MPKKGGRIVPLPVRTATAVLLFFLFTTATASASLDIRTAASDQVHHLEAQGFSIPDHSLVVIDWRWLLGMMIYSPKPVQYTILLLPWYWLSGLARAVIAHEYGHVLLRQADLPGDPEKMADRVAACFGMAEAQDWVRRFWSVDPSVEECADLRTQLIEGG